jgi:hypothetical protein
VNIPGLSVAILTGRSAACEEEGKATSEKKAGPETGGRGIPRQVQAWRISSKPFFVYGIELVSSPRVMRIVRERFLIAGGLSGV